MPAKLLASAVVPTDLYVDVAKEPRQVQSGDPDRIATIFECAVCHFTSVRDGWHNISSDPGGVGLNSTLHPQYVLEAVLCAYILPSGFFPRSKLEGSMI